MCKDYEVLPIKIQITLEQYQEIQKMSQSEWQNFSEKLIKNLNLPNGNYKVRIGFQIIVNPKLDIKGF